MAATPDQGSQNTSRESYVSREDRPEVKLDPDRPITELRVRDLAAILGQGLQTTVELKYRHEKAVIKIEKLEIKDYKEHKEIKEYKSEKHEKNEKIELEPYFIDPREQFGPRPEPWREVFEKVSSLTARVEQLSNQIEELQKRGRQ